MKAYRQRRCADKCGPISPHTIVPPPPAHVGIAGRVATATAVVTEQPARPAGVRW